MARRLIGEEDTTNYAHREQESDTLSVAIGHEDGDRIDAFARATTGLTYDPNQKYRVLQGERTRSVEPCPIIHRFDVPRSRFRGCEIPVPGQEGYDNNSDITTYAHEYRNSMDRSQRGTCT